MLNAAKTKEREVETAREFHEWLLAARPGDKASYHMGLLMRDRLRSPSGAERKNSVTDTLALAVMQASNRNMVHLVQERIDEHDCLYMAVRRDRL